MELIIAKAAWARDTLAPVEVFQKSHSLITMKGARTAKEAGSMLEPFISKYGERQEGEPKRLDKARLVKRKQNGFDLLRDFHDLWLLVNESMMSLNVLEQGARALRDEELLDALKHMKDRNERQRTWLKTRISQAAPQTLVVPV